MTFLLIHGAWHGAWCWDRQIEVLQARGEKAVAITLPSHRAGDRPGWRTTLTGYARAVNKAAAEIDGEIHLIGHSMGGSIISQAAELNPNRFASLTYVTAFLLKSGESIFRRSQEVPAPLLQAAATITPWRSRITLDPELSQKAFYNCCLKEHAKAAAARLCPQSIRVVAQKVSVTDDKWGRIPRQYVFCEQDSALPIELQRAMEADLPCAETVTLDTDHSPFLSEPEALAETLATFRHVRRK